MKPLELYYDPQDMTTCVSADTTVADLNEKAAKDGLYFPLFLTPAMTVGDLVLGYRFASRSYRFGPLCDNVLGFNFVLPSGDQVKVGAQVVKNVTGFDYARFLTNSGYRFGSVERVVLRLRAMAEAFACRRIEGAKPQLNDFRKKVLASGAKPPHPEGAAEGPVRHSRSSQNSAYGQVIDAFDFRVDEQGLSMQILFSCDQPQVALFDSALGALAKETGCVYSEEETPRGASVDPAVRVKTLISKCTGQASLLVEQFGGTAFGFVGNAFFHYDPPDLGADGLKSALQQLHEETSSCGGHVRSDLLEYPTDNLEIQWENQLKEKWEAMP